MTASTISYGRQYIDEDDIQAVVKVLQGDYLTQGPAVDEFETQLSEYSGAKHSVAVSNGTAALHIACLALGIGKGDAVFVPAITFAASANAVLYCGATPIFIDIEEPTLGINPNKLEEGIAVAKKLGLNPKAIIPVHFAGLPVNLCRISEIADNLKLKIIEDGCHALGARTKTKNSNEWQKLGESESEFVAWSFHPVKHITTGEGGALTTNSLELYSKAKALRTHGITRVETDFRQHELAYSNSKNGEKLVNPWYHEMQHLGFNYRMCDVQASLGASQLKKAHQFVQRRREIAAQYRKHLSDVSRLALPPEDTEFSEHSYHLFPIRINFTGLGQTRAEFMNKLKQAGIGTQVHYLPVFWHTFYRENRNLWSQIPCPVAEKFYAEELSIPMYPAMSDNQVLQVVTNLKTFLTPKGN